MISQSIDLNGATLVILFSLRGFTWRHGYSLLWMLDFEVRDSKMAFDSFVCFPITLPQIALKPVCLLFLLQCTICFELSPTT